MAIESILGGAGGDTVSEDTKALLASFMTDTIEGTSTVADLAGTGFMVTGIGSTGELQGVVSSGDVAVAAEIKDGSMTLNVALPSGVSIGFQGLPGDVTAEVAQTYMQSQIDAVLDPNSTNPVIQAYRASLSNALDLLLGGLNEKLNVKIVSLTDKTSATTGALGEEATATGTGNIITFDAGPTGSTSELLTFLMGEIKAGNTLELKGVSNALLIGDGSVVVSGSQAAKIVGDSASQKVVGGSGNDTLVGGGGSDILVGAGGNDVYGINAGGNLTIVADKGDSVAFKFDGLSTLEQLVSFVTNVSDSSAGISIDFVGGSANSGLTVTLVGLHAADVTADMIKFTI